MGIPSVTLRETQTPSAEEMPGASSSVKREVISGIVVAAIVEGLKELAKLALAV